MSTVEDALREGLARKGIAIHEANIDAWGFYSHEKRLIVLRRGLTRGQRTATLLHENIHSERGDEGHQTPKVEDRINEQVAYELISPLEYARAEIEAEGSLSGIAEILDYPVWCVESYRKILKRILGA